MRFIDRVNNFRVGDIIDFKVAGSVHVDCVVIDLNNELELTIDKGDGRESRIDCEQVCGVRMRPTSDVVEYTEDGNGLKVIVAKGPRVDIRKGDLVDFIETTKPTSGHLSWQVVDIDTNTSKPLTIEKANRSTGTFERCTISVCAVTKVKQKPVR